MTDKRPDNRLSGLLQEGWQHHSKGDLARARKYYRRALALEPRDADANDLMGMLLIQSGRPGDAITFIERALRSQSESIASWYNLGVAHQELGRPAQSRECFERALKIDPDHLETLNRLGKLLLMQNQFSEAEAALNKALKLQPGHPVTTLNIGLLENARLRFQQAEQAFRAVLKAQPDSAEANNGLGVACMGQGRVEEADLLFQKALELHPGFSDAHFNKGLVHLHKRERDQGTQCFERAVELDPANARALFSLGRMHEQSGRIEAAEARYLQAVGAEPGLVEARYQLAQMTRTPATEQEISETRELLESAPPRSAMSSTLAFTLGLLLDSREEYDPAFAAFEQAHRVARGATPFDCDRIERLHGQIQETFSKPFVHSFEKIGVPDERPVFIVGMPRSGTTLVEQILASHPLTHCAPEIPGLAQIVRRLVQDTGRKYPALVRDVTTTQWKNQAQQYLAELGEGAGSALRIIDNTPMNFIHAGLAAILLPDARFIFCLRDPLDNCVSIWRHALAELHNYAHDLHDLGRYYRLHLDLLAHWREVLGSRLFEWRYEALISNPGNQIRRLQEFVGLPPNPACLRFHETQRFVQTPAAKDVRRPIYDTSLGIWRRYESHLSSLIAALGDAASVIANTAPTASAQATLH